MIPTRPLTTMTGASVNTMIAQPVTISGLLFTMLFLVLETVDRTLAATAETGTTSILLVPRVIEVRAARMGRILALRIMQPLQMITKVAEAKAWNQVNMNRIVSKVTASLMRSTITWP